MTQKTTKKNQGFTLIELLVVVAIIALLSSIALIALISARQKSRDAKRLADMTQMNTALELFNAANKGYPGASVDGIPVGLSPDFASTLPQAPLPADGDCEMNNPTTGQSSNTYFYIPSGPITVNGATLYKDFSYYFCLGNKTGDFPAGTHYINPSGIK